MNNILSNTPTEQDSPTAGAPPVNVADDEKESNISPDTNIANQEGVEKEKKGAEAPESREQKTQTSKFKLKFGQQWKGKSSEELKGEIANQLKEQGLSDAPAEFIEGLANKVSGELHKKKRWQSFRKIFSAAVLSSILIAIASFTALIAQTAEKYVSREDLRTSLTNAVLKDSNIDDIKLVYQHEVSTPSVSIWPIIKPHLYYETSSLTLPQALSDIKILKLTTEKALDARDLELLNKINALVLDHNKFNPFDGLDEQSLRDFRGITIKLTEDEYEKIKDELLNLNSAIKEKNNLIGQYLSSSNLSLYVSMGAFVFSILVTIWQLLPKSRSTNSQAIAEAIEAINEQRHKKTRKFSLS